MSATTPARSLPTTVISISVLSLELWLANYVEISDTLDKPYTWKKYKSLDRVCVFRIRIQCSYILTTSTHAIILNCDFMRKYLYQAIVHMKRGINHQAQQQQQPHGRARGHKKNFDYNKPLDKCIICYTISGWHCGDCNNHFCSVHFTNHKQLDKCIKQTW